MSKQPRLTFVSTVHPSPISPGTGRFNAVMLRGLADAWQITAMVPVPWRQWGHAPAQPTHHTHDYPVHPFRYWYLPGTLGRASQGRLLYQQLERAARRSLVAAPPDLVLSYWAYPDADAAGRLAAHLDVPAAVVIGGSDILLQAASPGAHRTRVVRAILRHQMVFAVGEDLRDKLRDSGIPEARLRVLHRGVDRHHFHPGDRQESRLRLGVPAGRRVVLWAGRMEPVKDLGTLVRAVGALPSERRPILVLVGGGRESERTVALAREQQVDLLTPGQLTPARLGEWYRAADLFALSSTSEGTPNVLLEARASGLPIVTTDAGGAGDLGRRLGAPVVPIGDHAALARAIDGVLHGGETQWMPDDIPSLTTAADVFSKDLMELVHRGR